MLSLQREDRALVACGYRCSIMRTNELGPQTFVIKLDVQSDGSTWLAAGGELEVQIIDQVHARDSWGGWRQVELRIIDATNGAKLLRSVQQEREHRVVHCEQVIHKPYGEGKVAEDHQDDIPYSDCTSEKQR